MGEILQSRGKTFVDAQDFLKTNKAAQPFDMRSFVECERTPMIMRRVQKEGEWRRLITGGGERHAA